MTSGQEMERVFLQPWSPHGALIWKTFSGFDLPWSDLQKN